MSATASTTAAASASAPTTVKYPRWLVVDATVPADGQQNAQLTIPTDGDFEWWWIALFSTSSLLKVQIQEMATTRYFIYPQSGNPSGAGFNGIFVNLLAGLVSSNGAFPITVPYVMPASRIYNHSFLDSSGNPNNVEIAYSGYALLQFQSGGGTNS